MKEPEKKIVKSFYQAVRGMICVWQDERACAFTGIDAVMTVLYEDSSYVVIPVGFKCDSPTLNHPMRGAYIEKTVNLKLAKSLVKGLVNRRDIPRNKIKEYLRNELLRCGIYITPDAKKCLGIKEP